MERNIVRVLAVLTLLLLLAVDLSSLLSTVTQTLGLNTPLATKVENTRTAKKKGLGDDSLDEEEKQNLEILAHSPVARSTLMTTIRNSCLPKLICELNATPHRDRLTESEKSLLMLIRDTSIGTTAEITSKYHFAAHMGQLINGVDGTGCHNFYPSCPFPGLQVLQMMKKVKLR